MLLRALLVCLLVILGAAARAEDNFVIGIMNDESGPYADLAGPGSVEMAKMAIADFGGAVLGKPISSPIIRTRSTSGSPSRASGTTSAASARSSTSPIPASRSPSRRWRKSATAW